jgi:hypothetical protein
MQTSENMQSGSSTSENSVIAKFVEWIFHALALEIQAREKPGRLGVGNIG